jgi:Xaa-Pro aminopeptidase
MQQVIFFIFSLFFFVTNANAQHTLILSEQERAKVVDEILEDRLDNLLPQLMRRAGIDMWIIISREYNEDPVMKTMLPSTWLSARRRTIMVFFDKGGDAPLEKIAIARYDVGKLLKGAWDLNIYPDQWEALVEVIKARNPKKIGLNQSQYFALADGLVHTEYEQFMEKLPTNLHNRVVSAEKLAIAWLETRSEKELQIYPMICHLAHKILQEGLSEKNIHPGITTTSDVEWALRDLVTSYGLKTWFHPSVSVQRAAQGNQEFLRSFSRRPDQEIIRMGDLLHVDFGITYLRLNTDQQQHFYVLKNNENKVPDYLQKAFDNGNRLQDILTSQFKKGKSGNQILKDALNQAKTEGINGSIYTHPIGLHGHAAGPTIGMWDQQQGVKGNGDYQLFPNTAYSIELFAATEIPEWGKIVRIMLEEDGVYTEDGFYYLDNRMEQILTIPRKR